MTYNSYWKHLIWLPVTVALLGCSLDRLVKVSNTDQGSVVDQNVIESYEGAVGVYLSAVGALSPAYSVSSQDVGQFSDELGLTTSAYPNQIDTRYNPDGTGIVGPYTGWQTARVRAEQAVDLLKRYGPDAAKPLIGNAYAIQAYSIIMLGEMFCSGIPLTSVPYGGEVTYTRGFSTDELFNHALALLDTAYSYGQDSAAVATFIQVSRGRALLDLGRYDDAAAAVTNVATSDKVVLTYSDQQQNAFEFWTGADAAVSFHQIRNAKGTNGLNWLADTAVNQDPRIPVTLTPAGTQYQFPVKQQKFVSGTVTATLAGGIEARLIEAEAQLQPADAPSGPWLQTLNQLRETVGLPDTTDPGTATGRINLLFRERAFWLYLTGHRLGDMRRLVRQYGRSPSQVYPVGVVDGYPTTAYGNEYVFVPPTTGVGREQGLNPLYDGCIDRNP